MTRIADAMTNTDTPGEGLDPKAVDAAFEKLVAGVIERPEGPQASAVRAAFPDAIRAYLDASASDTAGPSDHAGLVATDYFGGLVAKARLSAAKAAKKFPQPNYVSLKIAEEAGEVVRGCVHYAENRMEWSEVEGEIVQLLAMLIRLVTEGDQVNGITPPEAIASAKRFKEGA